MTVMWKWLKGIFDMKKSPELLVLTLRSRQLRRSPSSRRHSNPLDVTASAQGSNASPTTGNTPQTHAANELTFAGLGLPSSTSVTVSAGGGAAIELQQANPSGSRAATEDAVLSSMGSFSGSFTLSGAAKWTTT